MSTVESMSQIYMNFAPELVAERQKALENCKTRSGRSELYRVYYLKMKEKFEKNEQAQDAELDAQLDEDEDEEEEEEEEEEDDINDPEYRPEDEEEEEVVEDEQEFGEEDIQCTDCLYEYRSGYENGWKDAMKYIASKTNKRVPKFNE